MAKTPEQILDEMIKDMHRRAAAEEQVLREMTNALVENQIRLEQSLRDVQYAVRLVRARPPAAYEVTKVGELPTFLCNYCGLTHLEADGPGCPHCENDAVLKQERAHVGECHEPNSDR